ncbi:MAG: 2-oxo acid dehydrogenase subunit E2 [Bacillota bacterium]|nr:2-oxo acid dehydrogenase subunit E2 [Bacillota bacterium]
MKVRRIGDRRDAVRVRDIDGMHFYMAYLMPKRTEAEVYLNETVDVTNLLEYIKNKYKTEGRKLSVFHCVITAVARTILMRPLLNRYVSGKHYYMRKKITMGFIIKKQFKDSSEESLMILTPNDNESVNDISDRIANKVKSTRGGNSSGSPDKALDLVKHLPKPLMHIFMFILRTADNLGLMPRVVTDMDTNYCTVLLSNLGSIKCNAVYHHLNNIGTNSIVITIGEIHQQMLPDENGELRVRDVLNLGVTLDERIADGFYFARSLKLVKHMFVNPDLLDIPLGEAIDYEF